MAIPGFATLLAFVMSSSLGCTGDRAQVAFSLGNFLNRVGDSAACWRIVYGNWHSKEILNKYSKSDCKQVYERDRICVGSQGRKLAKEQRTTPCSQEIVRYFQREKDAKIQKIKNERAKACEHGLQEWYNKKSINIGIYWQEFSRETCAYFIESGRYPENLAGKLDEYSRKWAVYQREKDIELKALREQELDQYNANLSMARARNQRINAGAKEKHFFHSTDHSEKYTVYEIIVPLASLKGGQTLAGQQVVDLNMRSYVNTEFNGETRARISCAQASHTGINSSGEQFPLGPSFRVSGDMGRWACGRFGFYHPPAR